MTVTDVEVQSPPPAPRASGRPMRWIAGALVVLFLAVGGAAAIGTYYYDSVPAPEVSSLSQSMVRTADLPAEVTFAFVAAVDPDFFESSGLPLTSSLISQRFAMIAAGDDDAWRARIMGDKLEAKYTREEILDFYLSTADYGRASVGLLTAAQTYFGKQPRQLTVAEAAVLAARLNPEGVDVQTRWAQVLDTMVERGWLDSRSRAALTFPR